MPEFKEYKIITQIGNHQIPICTTDSQLTNLQTFSFNLIFKKMNETKETIFFIFDRSLKSHKIAEYFHLKMYHMKMLKMFADISEFDLIRSLTNYM